MTAFNMNVVQIVRKDLARTLCYILFGDITSVVKREYNTNDKIF